MQICIKGKCHASFIDYQTLHNTARYSHCKNECFSMFSCVSFKKWKKKLLCIYAVNIVVEGKFCYTTQVNVICFYDWYLFFNIFSDELKFIH